MTQSVCQKLNLRKHSIDITLTGVNGNYSKVKNVSKAYVQSLKTSHRFSANFLVINKITNFIPTETINYKEWNIPTNIELADPDFYKRGDIDILLGAEVFWDILCVGQFKPSINRPILQKTTFGWIVGGSVGSSLPENTSVCNLCTNSVEQIISKFWTIESCPETLCPSVEDKECEVYYKESVAMTPKGRFIVSLPLKGNVENLKGSKEAAVKRFYLLEKRLMKNESLKKQYIEFMEEYFKLNHMELIKSDTYQGPTYYIPHHPVIREESLTTKLRVVFDASCSSTSKASLNDIMLSGPVVQDQLCAIIIRFRKHKYVMCADVEKMYRQILLNDDQKDLQRIVWRQDPSQPLQEYRLCTVTYGTRSAPYLATRTLIETANLHEQEYPEAAKIIKKDFYVDDLMTGSDSVENLITLQNQIREILGKHGFTLRKWCSNNQNIISNISSSETGTQTIHPIQTKDTIKTLGLQWHIPEDTFSFSVNVISGCNVSKRMILSQIAQIFDPLGLLGPVIVLAKILLQELWQLKLGWDETPPMQICTKWINYLNVLPSLNELHIKRRLSSLDNIIRREIHGFADASQSAYGAAIYLRCQDSNKNTTVQLICAKSRVAPIKTVTLPRLELCAAVLLTELVHYTVSALDLDIDSIYYWVDSKIVLYWISSPSNHWTTFVANRVTKIQELTKPSDWRHVKGSENPADCISRGLPANQIHNYSLWWNGPNWLHELLLPSNTTDYIHLDEDDVPEQRKIKTCMLISIPTFELIDRCSSLDKLIRITAYCKRFITNIRAKLNSANNQLRTNQLTLAELNNSLFMLIKIIQLQSFTEEVQSLQSGRPINRSSKLKSLNPFIDTNGIIRVGGRLGNSNLPYSRKYPIVLPSNHHFSELIVRNEHLINLHAGLQALLAAVHTKYWPIKGRSLAKRILNSCVRCFRVNPKSMTQIMGNLPQVRVQPSRPFINVGIDFAGPIYLSEGRKRAPSKAYILLFVCMATKAIHIELVKDLCTDTFLAALKRFMGRRGRCANIYCDNAKTFIGAQRQLKDLHDLLIKEDFRKINNYLINNTATNWHFIPPRSPNMGGLWEAGVKSIKHYLRKIVGDVKLNYEEMLTVLIQIESCLNSRPILPLSNNPNDLEPLTPSHFLVGDRLTANVEPDLRELNISRLSRWQHSQRVFQHFWKRWKNEYLSTLQQRAKWLKLTPNIKIGTLVVIKDDHLPPMNWMMGRVIEVHPGTDQAVRVVTVKTSTGVIKRAINKICPLPIKDNNIEDATASSRGAAC